MPERVHGGVFNQQVTTGSQRYFVIEGADFSGAVLNGQPVAFSSAEIIFNLISQSGYTNIMNPYSNGISFALETGRSTWDADTLQIAIQALGSNVGIDHVNCAICTVAEVPFNFQYLSGSGAAAFIDLTDVTVPAIPNAYIKWDSTGTVLEYALGSGSVITIKDEGTILGAADTINFVGPGVTTTFSGATATVTVPISETGTLHKYIPVPPSTFLAINKQYFVTAAGTVYLPSFTGAAIGSSVVVTKSPPNTSIVLVQSINAGNSIMTDIGSTDIIEIDACAESIFIYNGTMWAFQVGSIR